MRRLKIGIKPQLIILVCFSSLFSLLILAIVTGVYFSLNLSSLRADRLAVISQLKASQVKQSFQYILYQVYFVSTKDTLYSPLISYKAGNNSATMFAESQETLDQFLQSLETFAAARLYNLNMEVMADSYSNVTNISMSIMDYLYPLSINASVPQSLFSQSTDSEINVPTYFTGPTANSSDPDSKYFMGLTIPVYANTSILINNPLVAGYLSVISSASNIQQSINDTSTSSSSSVDYSVLVVKPQYGLANNNSKLNIVGFETVFPTTDDILIPGTVYDLESSPMIDLAIADSSNGYAEKISSFTSQYAMGFTQVTLTDTVYWSVIIKQSRSVFTAPVKKFTNIIIGVVIGIGVFMCLITFPLAVWFVRPITKLKEATEAITLSKKRGLAAAAAAAAAAAGGTGSYSGPSGPGSHGRSPPPYGTSSSVHTNHTRVSKRNSVNSAGSNSLYSYGIFLPGKIPPTKKFFKDEFSELSDAFNIMTEELDKQYTHLEDRVKVRTKELEILKIEAELANEAKTVFIANISHELRTPLNGILGMTSIAMDEKDASRIQDSLKLIHRSGELLLHILTELLTYSKNTLNRSKLEKLNFQVLEIVYQVQSIFQKLAIDQRVNLRISLMPNIIRKLIIYGDCNRIIQIVMNLVSNSLKFTPVDGSVGVTFKLLGEYDYLRLKQDEFKNVYVQETERQRGERVSKDDAAEVSTISSSEYDEVLNSAFYNETKALPELPKIVEVEGEGFDPLYNGEHPINEDFGAGLAPDSNRLGPQITKRQPPPIESIQLQDLKSSHFNRTSSYSTRTTDLEIVKNNKHFQIKRLSKTKSWVIQIQVTDTGPGIEPALQEKVFEPFIQGDQTLSRSYGGTGLGLSICRQLAKMMKGTLTLKSEIGIGSTFTFTVPLPQTHEILVPKDEMKEFCEDEFNPDSKMNRKVAFDEKVMVSDEGNTLSEAGSQIDNEKEIAEKGKPEIASDGNKFSSSSTVHSTGAVDQKLEVPLFQKPHLITRGSTGTANSAKFSDISSHEHLSDRISDLNVLVAEDNMVNQEVIKRMLKLEGILNISMACNGAEAIELLEESISNGAPFDMVFMDIQMPKVDGLLATRRIRQNLNYTNPIIALTAFADESNVKECLNCGMTGFLSKPIKRANLRKVIVEFSSDITTNGFEVNGVLHLLQQQNSNMPQSPPPPPKKLDNNSPSSNQLQQLPPSPPIKNYFHPYANQYSLNLYSNINTNGQGPAGPHSNSRPSTPPPKNSSSKGKYLPHSPLSKQQEDRQL